MEIWLDILGIVAVVAVVASSHGLTGAEGRRTRGGNVDFNMNSRAGDEHRGGLRRIRLQRRGRCGRRSGDRNTMVAP